MAKNSRPDIAVEPLVQVAALPWRRSEGRVEVCLVTTRETGRWTVPKGWRMKNLADHRAAEVEALQEAGLVGKARKEPIGSFDYWKRRTDRFDFVRVRVYAMKTVGSVPEWKEKGQRLIRWMSPEDAATAVDEPGLETLLTSFAAAKA